jgi:hypothetical protein
MSRTPTRQYRNLLTLVPLALVAAAASFGIGVQTSNQLRTIQGSAATEAPRGDVTGDGNVDERDAAVILEIAQGYRKATPAELAADPNSNGQLTVDDAIRVLRSISPR